MLLLFLFTWGWEEVYLGSSIQVFFQKQNILRNQNIPFKTKTINNSMRGLLNGLDSRGTSISRGLISSQDFYQIFVKKENAEYSKKLLRDN